MYMGTKYADGRNSAPPGDVKGIGWKMLNILTQQQPRTKSLEPDITLRVNK